jgi:hypothetical protein
LRKSEGVFTGAAPPPLPDLSAPPVLISLARVGGMLRGLGFGFGLCGAVLGGWGSALKKARPVGVGDRDERVGWIWSDP